MFRTPSCVFLLTACAFLAAADTRSSSKLTVVLDFQGTPSNQSVTAMEHETEGILKSSGLRLDWRLAADAAHESFDDLVVVQFKGACKVEPIPYVYDELGPLAFTYSADGTVQPFTQVSCNKVAASVRSAMWGGDFERADLLFGRALGRVLAHELVHMLTASVQHGREGVQKPALSGKELITGTLLLSPADIARLRAIQKNR
jgi:hypothetical protein